MKIKCPVYNCGKTFRITTHAKSHMLNKHDTILIAYAYFDLLFKIHEQIEFHKEHKKYNPKGGLSRQTIIFDFRIAEILESLLQE
jgi:hypothetical protein